MKNPESELLTTDYKGVKSKRNALQQIVNAVIVECATVAEAGYASATPEELTYGRFIAAELRKRIAA